MHRPHLRAYGLAWLIVLAGIFRAQAVDVNPPLPTGTLLIAGRVRIEVELARTTTEKVRGLSGRPALASGHGMLFVYDRPEVVSIWMKDMLFPLDIVWIRGGRIVHIEKEAPPLLPTGPEQIYSAVADLVLEVPAGFASRQQLRLGDSVKATLP